MDLWTLSAISLAVIFVATTMGSATVFLFRGGLSRSTYVIVLGFAGGIMIAASFFGLIQPSIDQSRELYDWYAIPPVAGFILGGFMLWVMDRTIPHIHRSSGVEEGIPSGLSANRKFFLAVTIHNIPEGLAVGFALGLALGQMDESLGYAALSLAMGIAIQNIPEGAAVSIPMYGDGESRWRSFLFGSFSGLVEPVFGIIGIMLAQLSVMTPWLLAFAAGAMIYVTLDDILPESRKEGMEHRSLWAFMTGFALMMILEMM